MASIKYFFGNTVRLLLAVSLSLTATQCKTKKQGVTHTVERAMYYWKSAYTVTGFEQRKADSLQVQTTYIRFFDVDWDELTREVAPKALIRFNQRPHGKFIPAVFITNETFQHIDSSQTAWLADKIGTLVKAILNKDSLPMPGELQIDCDWSAGTKNRYFAVLRHLKKAFPATELSATIRLYQTKYKDRAGIPPVDRGLLMCYNMGNLKNLQTVNSIIEPAELEKYTGNLGDYPLPLDVGLPIFDWKVWFRGGQYRGISTELPDSCLYSPVFVQDRNQFIAMYDTVIGDYGLLKGDVLRYENSRLDDVLKVAKHVSSKLKNTRCRVSLYHMDSLLLRKYTANELETVFTGFR